ncbi:MAG: 2-C-methyl-D-erythritol 4-phosphate cytidylyltransferase [Candidatus Omnitrophota bacterium]
MKLEAILLAAGRGKRLKNKISKPLIKILSKSILVYSLELFTKEPIIKKIIIVCNSKDISLVKKITKNFKKIKKITLGGKERRDSVRNALSEVDKDTDLVLIHDTARPCLKKSDLKKIIKAGIKFQAAVLGVPVKSTIKLKDKNSFVKKTLPRDFIYEIQTPQIFKKGIILEAFKKFKNSNFTDDASFVENIGKKVKIVTGSYSNIKITTPEDLILAEGIFKKSS